jgi:hypothetical protein
MAHINSRKWDWDALKRLHGSNHKRLPQTLLKQRASL